MQQDAHAICGLHQRNHLIQCKNFQWSMGLSTKSTTTCNNMPLHRDHCYSSKHLHHAYDIVQIFSSEVYLPLNHPNACSIPMQRQVTNSHEIQHVKINRFPTHGRSCAGRPVACTIASMLSLAWQRSWHTSTSLFISNYNAWDVGELQRICTSANVQIREFPHGVYAVIKARVHGPYSN